MKKILVIAVLSLSLFGACSNTPKAQTVQAAEKNMFVTVQGGGFDVYRIVYHKDTKVMYAISAGSYNSGTFTVLLAADGNPMLWEGGK